MSIFPACVYHCCIDIQPAGRLSISLSWYVLSKSVMATDCRLSTQCYDLSLFFVCHWRISPAKWGLLCSFVGTASQSNGQKLAFYSHSLSSRLFVLIALPQQSLFTISKKGGGRERKWKAGHLHFFPPSLSSSNYGCSFILLSGCC